MLMQTWSFFKKSLGNNILRGLELGEFSVFYQPKMDMESRKIKGLEALARWHSPGIGWIPPSEFIPIAESTGAIIELGEWILYSACEQMRHWRNNGYPELSVAVNLSPSQLEEKYLISRVEDILAKAGVEPRLLELEITESIFIKDTLRALTVLKDLKKLGLKLAIDDFGTGYSSVSYLTTFPFDSLKIDQSFSRTIHLPQTQVVIRALTNLSKQLGLTTVLEGIENETEIVMAGHLGCDQIQGYAVGRPMPVDVINLKMPDFLMDSGSLAGTMRDKNLS
jgi:EAL domain-containing protein (putative c-di-GMP-specific phosphodiesterase class I)